MLPIRDRPTLLAGLLLFYLTGNNYLHCVLEEIIGGFLHHCYSHTILIDPIRIKLLAQYEENVGLR